MSSDYALVPSNKSEFVSGRHRMILRSATFQRRHVFRFLDLPGEIRNMIYEILLGYGSVNGYFDRYVKQLEQCAKPKKMLPPSVKLIVPTILCLNREIFNEAVTMLRSKPLLLSHGLIEQQLSRVITGPTLQNITHLVITDAGHPVLDRRYPNSFGGFQKLVQCLKDTLKSGHKLKTFELRLTDPDLAWHVAHCWDSSQRCDMKKWTQGVVQSLRQIRGIDKVMVIGYLPQCFKNDLVKSMQADPCPLLRLPLSVRNKIYGHALDWNDATIPLNKHVGSPWVAPEQPATQPILTTPTMLLLNHQISTEVFQVLYEKRFVIDCDWSWYEMESPQSFLLPLQCISSTTLQQVRKLKLIIRRWESLAKLEAIIQVLAEQHSLADLCFHFEDEGKASLFNRQDIRSVHYLDYAYPDRALTKILAPLAQLRGIAKVTIGGGSLPDCFTRTLTARLESVAGAFVPPLQAEYADGSIVDLPEDDKKGDECSMAFGKSA